MTRLTAAEATNLSRAKDPFFAVDYILDGIAKAAADGLYQYSVRGYGFGESSCYCSESEFPPLCRAILKELRDLGYHCAMHAHEGQFVDLWLSVTWGKEIKS